MEMERSHPGLVPAMTHICIANVQQYFNEDECECRMTLVVQQ